jgi:ABC-type phosphate transport system substrate-binding protein
MSNSYGKQDEKSKEARAKRQFYIQKAMNLGMATIDGFKAITASLAQSPIAIGPVPSPAGIASLAFAGATSVANIMKIASAKYGGKGTPTTTAPPTAGGGGGGDTSTQAATPNVNLFGANNNANTFGANGQQQQGGQMVIKAVVVESDVTSVQNKMSKIQQSATL